jgi:hypothetical protein
LDSRAIRRRSALLVLWAIICTQAGLGQLKREARYAGSVSQSRLLTQVRELVAFGPRIGGTTSGDKAAAYVSRKFESAGYKPLTTADPARLSFEFLRWKLAVVQPRDMRSLIVNAWIGGYSPSVQETISDVVFVKDAGRASRAAVSGKAVLTESQPGERDYKKLVEYGVTCLLEMSPLLEDAYSDWALINDLPAADNNPIPLFNLSYTNGVQLLGALADGERVRIRFSAVTKVDSTHPKTVSATLEGESPKYYLVCAHGDSDSGGPGADDNASGVSTVLETARILKNLVETHQIPKPRYSVRFVVWGSEIFSTEEFVRSHQLELGNILGVLNLDEVGIGASRNCLYFESNDVKHNSRILRVLDSMGAEYAGKKNFWSEATTNPSQGGTDSYVFLPDYLKALKVMDVKIPSVTIYTAAWNELKPLVQTKGWKSAAWKGPVDTVYVDYSPYYHSSLDIPERTTEKEPFNMVVAAKAVGIALLRLAW